MACQFNKNDRFMRFVAMFSNEKMLFLAIVIGMTFLTASRINLNNILKVTWMNQLVAVLFGLLLLASIVMLILRAICVEPLTINKRGLTRTDNDAQKTSKGNVLVRVSSFLAKITISRKQSIIILIFCGVLFLALRFYFWQSGGNYADDWSHIVGALPYMETGRFAKLNEYFDGQYLRGSYMTLFVAILFSVFGTTIGVAKAAPFIIGILNFILFIFLAKKLIKNRALFLIAVLLYVINPFVLSNHSYIRHYVFYEMIFMINAFVLIYLLEKIRQSKRFIQLIIFLVLAMVNALFVFASHDTSSFVVLLPILVFVLFFVSSQSSEIITKNRLLKRIVEHSTVMKFFLLVSIGLIVAYVIPQTRDLLIWLTQADVNGNNPLNFGLFMLMIDLPLAISVLVAPFIPEFQKSVSKLFFTLLVFMSVALHLVSSPELQVLRGTAYLFPAIIISAILTLKWIASQFTNRLYSVVIVIAFTVSTVFLSLTMYQRNFFSFPSTYSDISSQEYDKAYKEVLSLQGKNKIFIADATTYPTIFYGIHDVEKINFTGTEYAPASHYEKNGSLYEISNNALVLTNTDVLTTEFAEKTGNCVVLRDYSLELYFNAEAKQILSEEYELVDDFIGFEIRCYEYSD